MICVFFSTFSMFSMSTLIKSSLLNFSILKESLEMLSTCLHSFRLVDHCCLSWSGGSYSACLKMCLSCRAAVISGFQLITCSFKASPRLLDSRCPFWISYSCVSCSRYFSCCNLLPQFFIFHQILLTWKNLIYKQPCVCEMLNVLV